MVNVLLEARCAGASTATAASNITLIDDLKADNERLITFIDNKVESQDLVVQGWHSEVYTPEELGQ